MSSQFEAPNTMRVKLGTSLFSLALLAIIASELWPNFWSHVHVPFMVSVCLWGSVDSILDIADYRRRSTQLIEAKKTEAEESGDSFTDEQFEAALTKNRHSSILGPVIWIAILAWVVGRITLMP